MIRDAAISLISENRHVTRTVVRALVSAGAQVHRADYRGGLKDELTQTRDLIIIDADHDHQAVESAVTEVAKCGRQSCLLLLCKDLPAVVAKMILDSELNHIVAKRGGVTINRDLIDENELLVTCKKLLTDDIFGISRYLATPDPNLHVHKIDHSGGRGPALAEFAGFLEAIDCYRGLRAEIVTAADELIMNAIFSAPSDKDGRAKYEHLDRSAQFSLAPEELVTFSYGCDGRNVVMSITDQFGGLGRDKLMQYLSVGLKNEKGSLNEGREGRTGGAGLGLHLVLSSINQLVFNVKTGMRTEVIASYFIRDGIRGSRACGQSLHLFTES